MLIKTSISALHKMSFCHMTSEIQILITDGFTVDLELVKHRCERLHCIIVNVLSPTCGRPVVMCSRVCTSKHIC